MEAHMLINTPHTNMPQPSSKNLRLRLSHWESREFLQGLTRNDISLPEKVITEREGFFWNAMLTEYDAKNFGRHLLEVNACNLSSEFLAFERAWSRDEWNHYIGFRSIYSMLYNYAENEIATNIENEKGDFRLIKEFSDDEFKICLLLAYDEIATSKSYFSEFPLYRAFGHPVFINWFKKVAVDELYHFMNCMELIRHRHPGRITEIADTIDMFIEYDMRRNQYNRTFVFDHYWYSRAFLEHCRELIVTYFKNGLRGAKFTAMVEMNSASPLYDRYTYL
jgi:hypothetical protein